MSIHVDRKGDHSDSLSKVVNDAAVSMRATREGWRYAVRSLALAARIGPSLALRVLIRFGVFLHGFVAAYPLPDGRGSDHGTHKGWRYTSRSLTVAALMRVTHKG